MANLDAEKLCTVKDKRNFLEMQTHISIAGEGKYNICLFMWDIVSYMYTSMLVQCDRKSKCNFLHFLI